MGCRFRLGGYLNSVVVGFVVQGFGSSGWQTHGLDCSYNCMMMVCSSIYAVKTQSAACQRVNVRGATCYRRAGVVESAEARRDYVPGLHRDVYIYICQYT